MSSYRLIDLYVPERNKRNSPAALPFVGSSEKRAKLMERAERSASNIELQLLTNVITESVVRLSSNTNRSFLFVLDWDKQVMRLSSINGEVRLPPELNVEFRKGEGAPGIVWEHKNILLANGAEEVACVLATAPTAQEVLDATGAKTPTAILCCPIVVYEEVVAAFLLEGLEETSRFTQGDTVFLERLCTSIASSISSAVLTDELSIEKERLESLVEQVFNAQEDERIRIARDLHDSTGQTLALAVVRASSCINQVPNDQPDLKQELLLLREDLKAAIQSIRENIADLRPSELASYGLVPCLENYVNDIQSKTMMSISLDPCPNLPVIPDRQSTIIFRIVQESVSNAIRHSSGSAIRISLHLTPQSLDVRIEDDGCGFDVSEVSNKAGKSFGLTGMTERASLLEGTCIIESHPGRGTRVTASFPINTIKSEVA